MKQGVEWLSAVASGATLTLSSVTGTAISFGAENLSTTGTLASGALTVTGAETVSGKLTLNGMTDKAPFSFTFNGGGATKGLDMLTPLNAAYSGSTGAYNIAYVSAGTAAGNGGSFAFAILGAGQTLAPAISAAGLDLTGDQTDNEGFDLVFGQMGTSGRIMYPGVDAAFKFCATINVTDVSDTDELFVGYRRPETVNATDANYDTYAQIGIIASAATAAIQLNTEDDAGGATTTDTTDTWADTATKALCVLVSGAGAVTYTINGAAPTATAAFSFDTGEGVIPTIRFLHAGSADCVPVVTTCAQSYQ
jgi:hypothetical protein